MRLPFNLLLLRTSRPFLFLFLARKPNLLARRTLLGLYVLLVDIVRKYNRKVEVWKLDKSVVEDLNCLLTPNNLASRLFNTIRIRLEERFDGVSDPFGALRYQTGS